MYIDQALPKDEVEYTMQPGDFIPTFFVGVYNEDDETLKSINDSEVFDFYYKYYQDGDDGDAGSQRIDAISCYDYINGPYWANYTEVEKANALK